MQRDTKRFSHHRFRLTNGILQSLASLSRYNTILNNVYALDNALRLWGYTCVLYNMHTVAADGKLTDFQEFLRALSGKISDARTVNRVTYGLPASVAGVFAYGSDMSIESILGRIMALTMVLYHPLEHGWYFTTLKSNIFGIDGGKWSLWSCRMWLIYVICDFIGTVKKLQEVSTGLEAKNIDKEQQSSLLRLRRNLIIWLTCIFSDFPIALQYSVASGPFSDRLLAWAGWYGGLAGLYRRWLNAQ